jgi:DNA repair protein RadC
VLKRENKFGRAKEHFWIVGLDNSNKILFIELLALGRHNMAIINAPDTFRMAIYKLAITAILVHNHPSGDLQYSQEDYEITDRLTKAGEMLNIDIVDHLIISETSHFSFMQEGIMQAIKKSNTWRIMKTPTKEEEQMEKEMNMEMGKRERDVAIATKMKAKGMSEDIIKEVTGLKLSAIRKL